MTPLNPRTPVQCPKTYGHPTIPAECCVMRTLTKGRGQAKHKPQYPACADCPLGRLRRQKLEAGGWVWDEKAWRKKQYDRLRSQVRARKRLLAVHGIDPRTLPE